MELVIEATDESGPCGLPAFPSRTTAKQNGDPMRDPEMCFELGLAGGTHLDPFYWRNDYVAVEQWSRNIVRDHYVFLVALHEQHEHFARTWDANLGCKAISPKPLRTSAFSASPLPWSGQSDARRSATFHAQPARKEPRIMETTVINATEYRNVSLSLLSESKTNPRRIFEDAALEGTRRKHPHPGRSLAVAGSAPHREWLRDRRRSAAVSGRADGRGRYRARPHRQHERRRKP